MLCHLGTNSTTYITCPAEASRTLGIKLPFLVMIVKNMKKYFSFEVQVLDDKNVRRRFRASNYQSQTRVKPFICTMPMVSVQLMYDARWTVTMTREVTCTKATIGSRVGVLWWSRCSLALGLFASLFLFTLALCKYVKFKVWSGKKRCSGWRDTSNKDWHAAFCACHV